MKNSKKLSRCFFIVFFLVIVFCWPVYVLIQNRNIPVLPRLKLSQCKINGTRVNVKDYVINELAYRDLPQGLNGDSLIFDEDRFYAPKDEKGLCLLLSKDGKSGYSPLMTFRYLMVLFNNYRISGEKKYFEKTRSISDALMLTAVESNGALYFPYTLDLSGSKNQHLKAPWYSGMAQGVGLSFYSRIYKITHDAKYLEIARKIFQSFKNIRNADKKPWVAYVDKNHYYWIEEYPAEPEDHTLNGFIYAIFGLYEYYLLDKTEESREILQAALTTVNYYLPLYRRIGGKSFYCLGHRERYGTYHKVHIKQLKQLFGITNDKYFLSMAGKFQADWKK